MRNVLCSGTLISSRHVLTVADCFNHTLIAWYLFLNNLYLTNFSKIRNETNDKNDTAKQILDFPIVVDENYLNQMMVIKSGRCTKNSCDFHEEPFSTKIKKVGYPISIWKQAAGLHSIGVFPWRVFLRDLQDIGWKHCCH